MSKISSTKSVVLSWFAKNINHSDAIWAIAVVAAWRLILQAYAVFVLHRFPFSDTIDHPFYFLTIWRNYDGGHYTSIAKNGYEVIQYAFFPLFPLTIKALAWPAHQLSNFTSKEWIAGLYMVAGIIIVTISLIIAIYFLLQVARLKFNLETGKRATLLLLFFPSAIFLAAIYTESFFLMWITGSFYFAFKKNWLWASLFAAAAAATRSVGIIMFACLAIEFYLAHRHQLSQYWRQALWLLLVPATLGSYMLYQWIVMDDPLHFIAVQKNWGREINTSVVSAVIKDMRFGLDWFNFGAKMIAPMYDAIAVLVGVGMAVLLAWKKYWSFALLTLVVTVLSLASGTTVGAIRYIIVAFPMFLLWGHWGRYQTVYSFTLAAFAICLAILSVHYLNAWWLA